MPEFPHLAFLPTGALLIHERHDDQRTRPLVLRIRASGVWRNPPVVSPLEDGSGRYMVLDGANRITALHEMGFPHALVQVVEPDDPGLALENWNHVVWEMNPLRFLKRLRSLPGLEMRRTTDALIEPSLEDESALLVVQSCRGHSYLLRPRAPVLEAAPPQAASLEQRVDLLHAVVDVYKDHARLDRTSAEDIRPLLGIYPSLCGLVNFPNFDIHALLRLAGQGILLPGGITRFAISPRALHLNYPLEALSSDQPLEEKNADLQKWIGERLAHKGVRYYAEATYLFDE